MNGDELQRTIEELEAVLDRLYHARAGTVDGVGPDGQPLFGWCCTCGRHLVNVRQGEDTCADCVASR